MEGQTAGSTDVATQPCQDTSSPFCPSLPVCTVATFSSPEMPASRGEDHGHSQPQFRNISRQKRFLPPRSGNRFQGRNLPLCGTPTLGCFLSKSRVRLVAD